MFVYHESTRLFWFSLSQKGNLREYNLIGVLMGLAVYNAIILDIHFPHICYKKLLSPPVVPNYDYVPVGVIHSFNVEDLAQIMPGVANSLESLLSYDGDVADLDLTFQVIAF
jgi:E3 ubiquitin-protein ligase HECTD2